MSSRDAEMAAILADAATRRARLSGNLATLTVQLTPQNLLHQGVRSARHAASSQAEKMVDEFQDLAADMLEDSLDFVKDNKALVIAGAVAAIAAAFGTRAATRKKTVPLYAAYDREDFTMTLQDDDDDTRAARSWDRVREEAEQIGNKAGEVYYSTRSRAASLSDSARERAGVAAEIARERAHEAAIIARESTEKARIAAEDAGRWAKREAEDHPVALIIIGVAVGAIIGALLPRSRSEDDYLGPSRQRFADSAKQQAMHAIDAAAARLEEAGITTGNARSALDSLADTARKVIGEATAAAADRLKAKG